LAVRILLWHGWLLEGSGSNIYTARVAEVFRSNGHDVVLMCQDAHPERYTWIDAWGTVDARGPSPLTANTGASPGARGRCILLRPLIGPMLPVFVVDPYEGFDRVRRFVDLTDGELRAYMEVNAEALRAVATWHDSEVVIAGHAVPGGTVASRALGVGRHVTTIHGSDIEYAIRPQERYRELAREGLTASRSVVGATGDVLDRCVALVPEVVDNTVAVPPGVDVRTFHPQAREQALRKSAERLDVDPDVVRGRPASLDADVDRAIAARDAASLDALADRYDQEVPDPGAADALRELAAVRAPLVGYFGKLIPQKGVELLVAARRVSRHDPAALIVGFGSFREWLTAVTHAFRDDDTEALAWLREAGSMPLDQETLGSIPSRGGRGVTFTGGRDVTFTGRLDHRYAPGAVAAMDVLVVPSILDEAFGMVAAEGAAAGALPLVARHSGLAEVAAALEGEVRRPGLFSFEQGTRAVANVAEGIDRLLSLREEERADLSGALSRFVGREWSWDRTAARLLDAAAT
jgi:glycosyltransferase involved in cell wall biosynthesis